MKELAVFVNNYKELGGLIEQLIQDLEACGDQMDSFDTDWNHDFVADVEFKIPARIYSWYDDNIKKQVYDLLDWFDRILSRDKELNDLKEYFEELRKALKKFEDSYQNTSIDPTEIDEIIHDIEMPIDDLGHLIEEMKHEAS